MSDIAQPASAAERTMLTQVLRPDWTVNEETGEPNSSRVFNAACRAAARDIRCKTGSISREQADDIARTIVADLAHSLGLGPVPPVQISQLDVDSKDNKLRLRFEWNGRVWNGEATCVTA